MEDSPAEKQQFKLLPPSEREYVELSSEKSKEYNKNTILQYNNRIRYRAVNAIKETAWLCDKLPEDQLMKIFTDELLDDIYKISEKASNIQEIKISGSLISHVQNLRKIYTTPADLEAEERLKKKYGSLDIVERKLVEEEHGRKACLYDLAKSEGDAHNLNEIAEAMETMLLDRGVTKEGLKERVYTLRNAKIIKNLEKQVAEGTLREEQSRPIVEVLSLSWEENKKRVLATINLLEEFKKGAKGEQARSLEISIIELRKQIE